MLFDHQLQHVTPKRLFLIDGIGAIVSAFLLGVVLMRFNAVIGLSKCILNFLALIPCCFAIYSTLCHLLIKEHWKPYLMCIAIFNILYCCLTLCVMIYYSGQLKAMAWLYFIGEIIIVITLAIIELRCAFSIDREFDK